MKKKILFLAPKIPFPPNDGHTKSMYGFIKATYELGFENDLVCYSQNKQFDNRLNEICNSYPLNIETKNNFYDAFLNLFSIVPYNLSKYKRKELIIFLDELLSKKKYDFIIIFNAHMGWVVKYLKQKTNSKILLREENLELSIMEKFYKNQKNIILKFYSWLQYQKFLIYEPSLCKNFDVCIMISESDEKKLLSFGKNIKTTVIKFGIEDELFKSTKNKIEEFSIFHIGSLNWYPNLDGVLWFLKEIFPLIIQKEPRAKFYIYGSKLPEHYISHDSIKNSVLNIGFVENIWSEISNKNISIVPLRIGSGIRIKILELIANSNIVVSTTLGAEGIGLENQKNIFIADDEISFANTIIELFNKSNKDEFIQQSKEFVYKNFGWNKFKNDIKNELKKL